MPYSEQSVENSAVAVWINSANEKHPVFAASRIDTVTGTGPTATTSSTTAIVANANRRGGWIQNVGSADVWVNFGTPAVANSCRLLYSGGDVLDLPPGYIGDVRVLSTSGTQQLACAEW